MKWIKKLDAPNRLESVPSQFFIRCVTRLGKRTVILYRYDSISHSGSKSNARKAASAMIAKIPLTLSTWIARVMNPPFPAARFACADLPSTCRPSDRAEPKQ